MRFQRQILSSAISHCVDYATVDSSLLMERSLCSVSRFMKRCGINVGSYVSSRDVKVSNYKHGRGKFDADINPANRKTLRAGLIEAIRESIQFF